MDYGEYLATKFSVAAALAVLKSKPSHMATQEYVKQLQHHIKSSCPDKLMDIDEISISSQDFDDDVVEETMPIPVKCGLLQNIQSYSKRSINNVADIEDNLPQCNGRRNVSHSEINATIETLNETEKNTYVIPDGVSEMYEECGQKLDEYSQTAELNQSNVNMPIRGYNAVNNGGINHENTATYTENRQQDEQIGIDDIMFSQCHWNDTFQVSTENLTHLHPKVVPMNDQEKVFIKKSVHSSNTKKNKPFPVSKQQNITANKNKIHTVLAESQNKELQSQIAIQKHNQDTKMVIQNMENAQYSQSENIVPYQSQNTASSFSQIIVTSQGQDLVPSKSQTVLSFQHQVASSHTQNIVPSLSQKLMSSQSQNMVSSQSQNMIPSQSQHVGTHRSQNIVTSQIQNIVQSHNQNTVPSQSENMVPLQTHNIELTCTVNEALPQTPNMLSQQRNCVEMLSQAITKPDIEVNSDIDMECDKDASKGVPFKIIMEMNKVNHILSRVDANAQDSGYRSDSQHSASCRSRNTGSLLSDDKLNQAAHTLVHHLYTCSGPALEHPVTSEVSATVARLVDMLHGVRSYPIFLDELLECVGTLVEEICSGESSGGDALLRKEESFHRLALLGESMEITTYAIGKLLDSLEEFHHRLTKDPEGTYEVGSIDDMENQCYAFQGLETLIVKYLSKKVRDRENQDLDLIQQTLGDPSPTQTDLPSSITELWRKRWDPNYKANTAEIKSKPNADITNRCGVVLKKFIVGCMDRYSLIAYSALECYNCLQP